MNRAFKNASKQRTGIPRIVAPASVPSSGVVSLKGVLSHASPTPSQKNVQLVTFPVSKTWNLVSACRVDDNDEIYMNYYRNTCHRIGKRCQTRGQNDCCKVEHHSLFVLR
jgi:hypothetical protein